MEQQTKSVGIKVNETDNTPIPALAYFSQQFETGLLRQKDFISGIQTKLHYILDRRVPEKEDEKGIASNDDLKGQLDKGLLKLEINNYQLERILNHLSEII